MERHIAAHVVRLRTGEKKHTGQRRMEKRREEMQSMEQDRVEFCKRRTLGHEQV